MSTQTWDQPPTSLRLTRRGRSVVLGLALLVAGGTLLAAQGAVAGAPASAVEVVAHTVVPGQTLWAIAADLTSPGQDVRDVVDALVRLNGLSGVDLQAGQQLLLPLEQAG